MNSKNLQHLDPIVQIGLASCHTLTSMKNTGALIGNEVEKKMFLATEWTLRERNSFTDAGQSLPTFSPPKCGKQVSFHVSK